MPAGLRPPADHRGRGRAAAGSRWALGNVVSPPPVHKPHTAPRDRRRRKAVRPMCELVGPYFSVFRSHLRSIRTECDYIRTPTTSHMSPEAVARRTVHGGEWQEEAARQRQRAHSRPTGPGGGHTHPSNKISQVISGGNQRVGRRCPRVGRGHAHGGAPSPVPGAAGAPGTCPHFFILVF